jgi:hypothetical protein
MGVPEPVEQGAATARFVLREINGPAWIRGFGPATAIVFATFAWEGIGERRPEPVLVALLALAAGM